MRRLGLLLLVASIGCGRMPTDPGSEPVAARPKPVTPAVCTLPPYGCKPDAISCYAIDATNGTNYVCVYQSHP